MNLSKYLSILLVLIIFPALQAQLHAAPKNPFLELAGNWRGKGDLKPRDGQPERISCRVKYAVSSGGTNVNQNIRCAGSGYWINATTKLRYTPGSKTLKGTWTANYGDKSNPKRSTTGNVSGAYINDVISISLDSTDFTGEMVISLKGKKQLVSIGSFANLVLTR